MISLVLSLITVSASIDGYETMDCSTFFDSVAREACRALQTEAGSQSLQVRQLKKRGDGSPGSAPSGWVDSTNSDTGIFGAYSGYYEEWDDDGGIVRIVGFKTEGKSGVREGDARRQCQARFFDDCNDSDCRYCYSWCAQCGDDDNTCDTWMCECDHDADSHYTEDDDDAYHEPCDERCGFPCARHSADDDDGHVSILSSEELSDLGFGAEYGLDEST